jgi:murein DD-endopeptidase MepM/ murein hydrolase activator NlpD
LQFGKTEKDLCLLPLYGSNKWIVKVVKQTLESNSMKRIGFFVIRVSAYASAAFVSAFALYFLFSSYIPSPREKALERKISDMQLVFEEIDAQLEQANYVLDNLRDRDSKVYELLLGTEPIDHNIWIGGTGGHDRSKEWISDDLTFGDLESKMEQLERKIVLQSRYLEDVEKDAALREEKLASIPSIRPLSKHSNSYLRMLSGFGMRNHPVYHIRRMHKGMDFPAPIGTPIVATGDGKVHRVKNQRTGYGKSIIIDHGFGYKTLYAHLNSIDVKKGDKIKKGQHIGTIGRTGTATAPHLHYEVHHHDSPINPIHFCMDGLSPEEYQQLVEAASVPNQSFD